MADLHKTFGNLLAAHRRAKSLTQEQLAHRVNLSVDMIVRLEGGNTGASFQSIATLAKALEIDPAALFSPDFKAPAVSRPVFKRLTARLAKESDETVEWLAGVISSVLKPRA